MEHGEQCAMEHQITGIITHGISMMQELYAVSLDIKN